MKKVPYKIIEVNWIDSESAADDWTELKDILEVSTRTLECRTIGYLLSETDDRLVLGSSIDIANLRIGAHIMIPKVAIRETREIKTSSGRQRKKKIVIEEIPTTE